MADRMFPAYVRNDIDRALNYGCCHQANGMPWPHFTFKEAREHFVQPADWPILERAATILGLKERESYTIPLQVEGWMCSFSIDLPELKGWLWPREPTVGMIHERGYSEQMEAVYQWAEHRRDTARQWALVEGMIDAFDASGRPVSMLRDLWPDFDMLLTLPGRRVDYKTREWVAKQFRGAGKPRYVEFPVANTMDYLEEIRSTVLAMTLMPEELPSPPEGAYNCRIWDHGNMIELPWGAKLRPRL